MNEKQAAYIAELNRGYSTGEYSHATRSRDDLRMDHKPAKSPASESQIGGDHYRSLAIQPSEFIQRNGIDWLSGNIIKYAARHKRKNGAEDVRKIIHYAELLLEWEYGE